LYGAVTGDRAETIEGIAHRLTETVPSLVDGSHVLAEQLIIRTKAGVIFRKTSSARFLVELVGGERVVIEPGVLRIATSATTGPIAKDDARYDTLGIPAPLRVTGELIASCVREGDRVSVTGETSVEMAQELAFHRDAGEVRLMRGRSGAVVAVKASASSM
jgi:hypothetical protein